MDQPGDSKDADPIQRFFRYFQMEATALQEQMSRLKDVPTIGGERMDACDHCLAGISRLQKEVQDASSYISSYDQRMYSDGVKALYEKLEQTRTALAPKAKFSFKSSIKKNDSAVSLGDAAELAKQQRASLLRQNSRQMSSADSSQAQTPDATATPPDSVETPRPIEPLRRGSLGSFLKAAGIEEGDSEIRKQQTPLAKDITLTPSNAVNISSHSNLHIIIPPSASNATSPGSLVNLRHCIVDMSTPAASGHPYAGLTIRNVKKSLLICGIVDGAAHVTSVQDSVMLVTTNQFRMHDCQNCTVYLHVKSRPVIENCSDIRFAPLPQAYALHVKDTSAVNLWDQVQDFNWPKAGHSPNWRPLKAEEVVTDKIWSVIIELGPEWSLEGILKSVKVPGLEQNTDPEPIEAQP